MFKWNFLYFNLCPFPLVLSFHSAPVRRALLLFLTSPHQIFAYIYEIPPEPPSLWTKQSQLLSLSFYETCFSPSIIFMTFCCSCSTISVSLPLGSPELDRALQWGLPSGERKNHSPAPAVYIVAERPQGAVDVLYHRGILLTHVQLVVLQDHQGLF